MDTILYHKGDYDVRRTNKGTFEVYRNEVTHAVRCAIIGYEGNQGLRRAIVECDKRAAIVNS